MSDDFKRIVSEIHSDVDSHPDEIFIVDEDDTHITVSDIIEFERNYCITDTDAITKEWLKEKIIITPSAKKRINKENITDWIFNKIPKETYQTLNRLVFISNDEKDFDYLCELKNEDFDDLLQIHNLPDDNQLGINWSADCYVIIHVGNIVKSTNKMVSNGELYDYEKEDCIRWGILTTIAHELRHLEQENPYLSEEIYKSFIDDPEEDAETFAQSIV